MATLLERIEKRIFVAPDGCWLWTASVDGAGYGRISIGNNKYRRAHRAYFEIVKGKIADGLVIDHLCKQRSCVNPFHLEAVTQKENVWRGKIVKHICKHGNPMNGCSKECKAEYLHTWYSNNRKAGE